MNISMSSAERPAPDFKPREQVIPHEMIPDVLKQYPQWVCWRYVDRGSDKKPDKRPINPHNLHNAGVNWPNTWSNFAHTYMVYLMHRTRWVNGIGFVLTNADSFVGLDLDSCLDQQGQLSPWARGILDHLPSYTEVSPSGTGLRILVTTPGFTQNRRHEHLEIYSHDRFLTITGKHIASTPGHIQSFFAEHLVALVPSGSDVRKVQPATPREARTLSEGGAELWEQIFARDRYGEQHRLRFLGDTSLDGGDHSLTVIRLLNTLARWTRGDTAKMRVMISMSPLANDKWWTPRGKTDWLGYQIEDATRFVASHD